MVQDAPKLAERESKSRIGIIEETAKGPCQCKGEWLRCAEEVLAKNKINIYVFAHAMWQCLIFGRRKNTKRFVDRTYKLWQIVSAESH